MESNRISNDWLGTQQIFFDVETGEVSTQILDLVKGSWEWDEEGLYYYLRSGFSILGKTPIKNIHFIPAGHTLEANLSLSVNAGSDDESLINTLNKGPYSDEHECIEKTTNFINSSLATSGNKDTIVPLSGGFDSRLILNLIEDKSNIHAYSYGISKHQSYSQEVVYAKEIARICEIDWDQISLGNFHHQRFVDGWYENYGPSTHLHGMYHMEFYEKINERQSLNTANLISGVVGDVWSGNITIPEINRPEDVFNLTFHHGLAIHDDFIQLPKSNLGRLENYYEEKKAFLTDERFRIIEAIRFKLFLLSYLMKVPETFGANVISPFLDKDVSLSILKLDPERKKGRKWQVDYFKKEGLFIEDKLGLKDRSNYSDSEAWLRSDLPSLVPELFEGIIDPDFIITINRILPFGQFKKTLSRFNPRRKPISHLVNSYWVLYPLQRLLLEKGK